jgi:probable F420-dependent oxidoreductase
MPDQRPFRFGVVAAQARSGDEWAAKARRAEALGYSTFLIPDTLGPTLAPLPALAVAAAATRTLRVGTYVLANDYRNPALLARECATLDFLSGGRFELGLGAGRPGAESDYRKLGLARDSGGVRIERLAEALRIVKALLSGEHVSAGGPHYKLADADVFPRPVQQPHPPILVAGGGKRLLALAAREADIIALAVGPETTETAAAETVSRIKEAAGERFDRLELNCNLLAVGELPPQWLPPGVDLARLRQSGSLAVVMGGVDEMCDRLMARREALGISYVTHGEAAMEAFAPVVERLTGQG